MGTITPVACHHCGSPTLMAVPAFTRLHRVASDCRPWPGSGELAICDACGLVQKPVTSKWQAEIAAIYADYRMYHQSADESEQRVAASGGFEKRSDFLLNWLKTSVSLPERGRYLDFGCGNGATLRSASNAFPEWHLYGYEPNLSDPGKIIAIPGVESVLKDLAEVEMPFDLISMMHVLEHIPNPGRILSVLRERLAPEGFLFIQVPYFPDSPYELCVADHCSHFTIPAIMDVVTSAGLKIVKASASVLKKEITVVACRPEQVAFAAVPAMRENVIARAAALAACIDWLCAIPRQARSGAARPFGIFGTSIAGTWLYSHIADLVDFFVDEDQSRAGLEFLGRPIYLPKDVPSNACAYVALVPDLSRRIADRHADLPVTWLVPPPLDLTLPCPETERAG